MRINESRRRQTVAKLFFVVFFVVIAIDTIPLAISSGPGPFSFVYSLKTAIRPALRPTGLWQAEWRLFAPDPVIRNCWWTIEAKGELSGELQHELNPQGEQTEPGQAIPLSWNSPFWGEIGPAQKFFKRRHIAYTRRLSEFPISVVEDYADHWVRERFGNRLHALGNLQLDDVLIENGLLGSSVAGSIDASEPYLLELNVYRNELKLSLPDDGSLPTREENVWLSVTEKYLQRRYGP
jgi:hypothetical protein